ncbi:UNKNOWN [Stylonychia lemnae]|uniref:Uncharacterized protein n=1 Tax=Stylonychia lemnae TaxID=5949 RepID=A0A078A339_STYLE|nr:UNKNOWN [Stylonychia lemnae]|eukprot:CDW75913.1 UNKNOWN [Stylonychia lemnae]
MVSSSAYSRYTNMVLAKPQFSAKISKILTVSTVQFVQFDSPPASFQRAPGTARSLIILILKKFSTQLNSLGIEIEVLITLPIRPEDISLEKERKVVKLQKGEDCFSR